MGMQADLRATAQTWLEDLNTQTKLWGCRLTLGLQPKSSHPQIWCCCQTLRKRRYIQPYNISIYDGWQKWAILSADNFLRYINNKAMNLVTWAAVDISRFFLKSWFQKIIPSFNKWYHQKVLIESFPMNGHGNRFWQFLRFFTIFLSISFGERRRHPHWKG
jgi:hypothetical protein